MEVIQLLESCEERPDLIGLVGGMGRNRSPNISGPSKATKHQ